MIPPSSLEALMDVLGNAAARGEISWQAADRALQLAEESATHKASAPGRREEFHKLLVSLPAPAWWQGACVEEVLSFGLHPGHPGDGSGIPHLSDAELEAQIHRGRAWQHGGYSSSWLSTWMALLRVEFQARVKVPA